MRGTSRSLVVFSGEEMDTGERRHSGEPSHLSRGANWFALPRFKGVCRAKGVWGGLHDWRYSPQDWKEGLLFGGGRVCFSVWFFALVVFQKKKNERRGVFFGCVLIRIRIRGLSTEEKRKKKEH